MKKMIVAMALALTPLSLLANPSVYLYDESTHQVVVDRNSSDTRPIASITKLMTAMVTLTYDADLTRRIRVPSGSRLPAGYHSRHDVLTAMLVKSDNVAALALAQDYPSGVDGFVQQMNIHARRLNMNNTKFVDSSGRGRDNVSTAEEVGIMVREASTFPVIRLISPQTTVSIDNVPVKTVAHQRKHGKKVTKVTYHALHLDNTNKVLLSQLDDVVVSKTGFTNPAGFCVGMMFENGINRFQLVVLGARDKNVRKEIALEAIKNFQSKTVQTKKSEYIKYEFTYPI